MNPKSINILVGCEESQAVTIAFRKLGFNSFSCDILDCSGGHPEWHIKDDVIKAIKSQRWDLIIVHPPCDRLANSGVRWLSERNLWHEMYKSCAFFNVFTGLGGLGFRIIIENPIQHNHARLRIEKYHQIIQPYQFGHMEKKATCLWVYNMPELKETNNVYDEMMKLSYRERAKVHYCSPGKDRAKIRAKTYPGIAEAMAQQWGDYLLNKLTIE